MELSEWKDEMVTAKRGPNKGKSFDAYQVVLALNDEDPAYDEFGDAKVRKTLWYRQNADGDVEVGQKAANFIEALHGLEPDEIDEGELIGDGRPPEIGTLVIAHILETADGYNEIDRLEPYDGKRKKGKSRAKAKAKAVPKKQEMPNYDPDDIREMKRGPLVDIIDEEELDIDPDDLSLKELRSAVLDALDLSPDEGGADEAEKEVDKPKPKPPARAKKGGSAKKSKYHFGDDDDE